MATADSISSVESPSQMRVLSDLLKRINQVHGLIDVIGNVDFGAETLDVNSMNNASWAAKDLLNEARSLTERLYHFSIMESSKQAGSPA